MSLLAADHYELTMPLCLLPLAVMSNLLLVEPTLYVADQRLSDSASDQLKAVTLLSSKPIK